MQHMRAVTVDEGEVVVAEDATAHVYHLVACGSVLLQEPHTPTHPSWLAPTTPTPHALASSPDDAHTGGAASSSGAVVEKATAGMLTTTRTLQTLTTGHAGEPLTPTPGP